MTAASCLIVMTTEWAAFVFPLFKHARVWYRGSFFPIRESSFLRASKLSRGTDAKSKTHLGEQVCEGVRCRFSYTCCKDQRAKRKYLAEEMNDKLWENQSFISAWKKRIQNNCLNHFSFFTSLCTFLLFSFVVLSFLSAVWLYDFYSKFIILVPSFFPFFSVTLEPVFPFNRYPSFSFASINSIPSPLSLSAKKKPRGLNPWPHSHQQLRRTLSAGEHFGASSSKAGATKLVRRARSRSGVNLDASQ